VKVVYLFGAGVTQGEIKMVDDSISMLTKDLRDDIIKTIEKGKGKLLNVVVNELNADANIEHLISLYESVGTEKHKKIAQKLKELFREAILNKLKLLENNYPSFKPILISSVIDMHEIKGFKEELIAILTLNYDDITELAINEINNSINYYIKVKTSETNHKFNNRNIFPFIKLHGSFNWKRDYPVRIVDKFDLRNECDVLWIPPGVEKKKDNYPFNMLWAKAKELLSCDILRIIGCSLNRNDWQLVALIFAIQKINQSKKFTIQLINYYDIGKEIKSNYPYLRMETIIDILECKEYFVDLFGYSSDKFIQSDMIDYLSSENTKINIFEWWLRAKGFEINNNKHIKSMNTKNSIYEKLINQEI
jgi:hypothetical protein